MCHTSKNDTLKTTDFGYFHSKKKQRVTCRSNSSKSGKVFTLQKKTVEIMADAKQKFMQKPV